MGLCVFNSMKSKVEEIYRREMFYPSFLGLFINPFYFARKGLVTHLRELAPQITGQVLDVGCGNKPYVPLYGAQKYTGLEIDNPENRQGKQADYYYDGGLFPFSNEAFDSVVSNQVFEHVPNPDQFLDELSRVLKPKGLMLITAPFVWDEHEQPHDYTRYTSFGIRSILNRHGFEIIALRKSTDDIRIIFQFINAYLYKKTLTKWKIINLVMTILLMAPVNIVGEVIFLVTPRNEDLYLDNIVLARKGQA